MRSVDSVSLNAQRGEECSRGSAVTIRNTPFCEANVNIRFEFKTEEEFNEWLVDDYVKLGKGNRSLITKSLNVFEKYDNL